MSEEDHDEALQLYKSGTVIESPDKKYTVIGVLGESGYGAAYNPRKEMVDQDSCILGVVDKLKGTSEIDILKLLSSEPKPLHFTSILDAGVKENNSFWVFHLVGKFLSDFKSALPDKVLSTICGLSVSKQCLEACQELHQIGYVHRDVRPAQFAVGLGNESRLIYMLRFDIARKITNEKGELKAPRPSVRYKGTIRFGSLAHHKKFELGPKDDCESLFYMLLDLILPTGLPWKNIPYSQKEEVYQMKQNCRSNNMELMLPAHLKCRGELMKLLEYFDSLQYSDKVDYGYAYKLLGEAAAVCGGSLSDKFDWE